MAGVGSGWRSALMCTSLMLMAQAAPMAAYAETGVALRQDGAAEIAAVLYAASVTRSAAQSLLDDRLREAEREIEDLRRQGQQARLTLAAAQERYVLELAERSEAYAQEIAAFRQDVTDIAATPEGVRALGLYASGDAAAGREVLTRLREARARAERRAADIREAVYARQTARLDLDAMRRGNLDTATVLADYELVTRLDPSVSGDWLELARLYRDAGRVAQAEDALTRGQEVARDAAERGRLELERAAILSARLDASGAHAAALNAQAELTAASVAASSDLSIARDLLEARMRASADSSETDPAARIEALAQVRELIVRDPGNVALQLTFLNIVMRLATEAGERQETRVALEHLRAAFEALDALDANSDASAERVAVDRARANLLSLSADLSEQEHEDETALQARVLRVNVLREIAQSNPSSAVARQELALARIDMGVSALRVGHTLATSLAEGGEQIDDGALAVRDGLEVLRQMANADPRDAETQIALANALTTGGLALLESHVGESEREQRRREGRALWDEGVALIRTLARTYPDRADFQTSAATAPLVYLGQESDIEARAALLSSATQTLRRLAEAHPTDLDIQNNYFFALSLSVSAAVEAGDSQNVRRGERELEALVAQVARRAPRHPAGQSALANFHRGLGNYFLEKGEQERALDAYEAAFAIQERLADADPEIYAFRDDLREDLVSLASRLASAGRTSDAVRFYERSLDLYRRAFARTGGLYERNRLDDVLFESVGYYEDLGEMEAARARVRERADVMRLSAPSDRWAHQGLILRLSDLASRSMELGAREDALAAIEEVLALTRGPRPPPTQASSGADNANDAAELARGEAFYAETKAGALAQAGRNLQRLGDDARTRAVLDEADAALAAVIVGGASVSGRFADVAGVAYSGLLVGETYLALGELENARRVAASISGFVSSFGADERADGGDGAHALAGRLSQGVSLALRAQAQLEGLSAQRRALAEALPALRADMALDASLGATAIDTAQGAPEAAVAQPADHLAARMRAMELLRRGAALTGENPMAAAATFVAAANAADTVGAGDAALLALAHYRAALSYFTAGEDVLGAHHLRRVLRLGWAAYNKEPDNLALRFNLGVQAAAVALSAQIDAASDGGGSDALSQPSLYAVYYLAPLVDDDAEARDLVHRLIAPLDTSSVFFASGLASQNPSSPVLDPEQAWLVDTALGGGVGLSPGPYRVGLETLLRDASARGRFSGSPSQTAQAARLHAEAGRAGAALWLLSGRAAEPALALAESEVLRTRAQGEMSADNFTAARASLGAAHARAAAASGSEAQRQRARVALTRAVLERLAGDEAAALRALSEAQAMAQRVLATLPDDEVGARISWQAQRMRQGGANLYAAQIAAAASAEAANLP